MNESTYTAFADHDRLRTGTLQDALSAAWEHAQRRPHASIVIFDDATGQHRDHDLRGTLQDTLDRARPEPAPTPGPGRPKLGVVSREVSLLPRHWAWLEQGRGGASATLRRLIDEARRADPEGERRRQTTEAAGRFMTVLAGHLPGYEEASRALYAGDTDRLYAQIRDWPDSVQAHLLYLLDPPFQLQG